MVAREVIERRHADFQAFRGDPRGLQINHLQRLADPFPGTPRHNPGTLSLRWAHSRHTGGLAMSPARPALIYRKYLIRTKELLNACRVLHSWRSRGPQHCPIYR
jgi:hypothetical protein